MVDHFQLATMGVGPGWSTFGFATSGFGFDIEVEIRPVVSGGGTKPTVWYDDQPYEIIVRVKFNGKVWEERRFISALAAKSIEKVISWFKKLSPAESISVVAKKISMKIQKIWVRVHR